MRRTPAVLIALSVLVFLALACGSPTATPSLMTATPKTGDAGGTTSGTKAPDAPKGATRLKVGDSAKIGNLKITVNSSSILKPTNSAKPKDGNQFIGIDLTIENVGDKKETFSSMLSLKLKDDTGQEYSDDLEASMASSKKAPDGSIEVGDKLRGVQAYQVPKDAKTLTFYYEEFAGAGASWDVTPSK